MYRSALKVKIEVGGGGYLGWTKKNAGRIDSYRSNRNIASYI